MENYRFTDKDYICPKIEFLLYKFNIDAYKYYITLYEVRKCILEIFNVDIIVTICKHDGKKAYVYACLEPSENGMIEMYEDTYYDTYEDALRGGIIYFLEQRLKENE